MAVFNGLILRKKTKKPWGYFTYRQFYYRIKEENAILAKQTGKTSNVPKGALHHECNTIERFKVLHWLITW